MVLSPPYSHSDLSKKGLVILSSHTHIPFPSYLWSILLILHWGKKLVKFNFTKFFVSFYHKWNYNFKICLDIDDQELDEIESQKRARLVQELIENPPPYANPVQLVSKAADHIVLKIVNNVCHEAIEEDLVQKLVQAELKSFNWHQLIKK